MRPLRGAFVAADARNMQWSIPTIKNLVKNDVGVTILPRFTIEDELARGELVEIETEIASPVITAVCGRHKNKWVSPLMQLFIDLTAREPVVPFPVESQVV